MAEVWPSAVDISIEVMAVYHSVLEVAAGIRFSRSEWDSWVGVPREEIRALVEKMKRLLDAGIIPHPESDPPTHRRHRGR